MTVRELIQELEKHDPERKVVLSTDEEGNGFKYLYNIETNYVFVDGELYLQELTKDAEKAGYNEDDVYDGEDGELIVLLWP